jgi:hypothetical protein
MEKWEYKTRILNSSIDDDGVKKYLLRTYPNSEIPKYSPETMEKLLNEEGQNGWELIHMQPVAGVGANGDVWWQGGAVPTYSNAYFCVFKKRIDQ